MLKARAMPNGSEKTKVLVQVARGLPPPYHEQALDLLHEATMLARVEGSNGQKIRKFGPGGSSCASFGREHSTNPSFGRSKCASYHERAIQVDILIELANQVAGQRTWSGVTISKPGDNSYSKY